MVGVNTQSLFKKMWIPRYKWQLVKWLREKYPKDAEKFKYMTKKKLYAIYFSARGITDGR